MSKPIPGLPLFRLKGHGGQQYEIGGNPHTFDGLVALFDASNGERFSVQASDLVPLSEYGDGWRAGYMSGSEPDPDPLGLLPRTRSLREFEFYRRNSRRLEERRRGLITLAGYCSERAGVSIDDGCRIVSSLLLALSDEFNFWSSVEWIPVAGRRFYHPAVRVLTESDVKSMLINLNNGYAFSRQNSCPLELALVSEGGSVGQVDGCAEIIIRFEPTCEDKNIVSFMIHAEHPRVIIDDAERGLRDSDIASFFDVAVEALDPDIASMSGGDPLMYSDGIGLFLPDSTYVIVNPGPVMHLSNRTIKQNSLPLDLYGFHVGDYGNGVNIRYTDGFSQFSVAAGNRLSNLLDSESRGIG